MKFKFTSAWQNEIFSGVDDFYTERNLMKFFRKKYDKDTFCVYRSVLKRIARDSEKAYKVGVEEGLVGNPKPTTEGLQDLLKGTKHHEELEAIYLFIYDACVAGYVTGQAKKVITPEVK